LSVAGREWIGSKYETPESQGYVGLSRTAALDFAQAAGIKRIRVLGVGNDRFTVDFDPKRLDLLVEEDVVVAAGFF
jgi:hypothetical protein